MKITDRLIGDHKTFRKMIAELDGMALLSPEKIDKKRFIRLVELFIDHMVIHTWGEDTFYYPFLRRAAEKCRVLPILSCLDKLDEQHKAFDKIVIQLEKEVKTNSSASVWLHTYALFNGQLNSHMKIEEQEIFPLSEILLGEEQLEKLSLELEKRRADAPKANHHVYS